MQLIFYFLSPSINQIAPNFNPEEFTTFNQTAKKHNVILNYLTCFRNFYLHGIFLQFLSKFSVGFVVVNQISAYRAPNFAAFFACRATTFNFFSVCSFLPIFFFKILQWEIIKN